MNARVMALRLPAVATAALLLGFGSQASAQAPSSGETLSLDTYQPQNSGSVSVASQPLQAGQAYTVTVSGTWSAWNARTWSRNDSGSTVCGTPEDGPMTASAN